MPSWERVEVTPEPAAVVAVGWIRKGFLEEVNTSLLFSAVPPTQGDQLILVCWGLFWFQH